MSNPPPSPATPDAAQVVIATVDHNGRKIPFSFPNSGNIGGHLQAIFSGAEYPLPPLQGYSPDVIVDIGANVGATGLFFNMAYPNARLLCYEPSPGNVVFLRKNLGELPNVETFDYGLHDHAEDVKLYTGRLQTMQNSMARSIETSESFEAARVRKASDEFIERGLNAPNKSMLLKLDTEGCEVPILRDLAQKDLLAPIDLLYVEYHSENDRRAIEQLLTADDRFMLAIATARIAHRGTNCYVARKLVARFPALDAMKIEHSA